MPSSPAVRLLCLAAALATLAGCPKGAAQRSSGADSLEALRPEVRRLSRAAAALLKDQDELVWKAWTEGTEADVAGTYAGQEALFTPASVSAIQRVRAAATDPTERRALTHLEVHFAGEHLARELAEVSTAVANVAASATVEAGGREVPYRELERVLANEKDADKRRALYLAATPAVERISQSLRRKEQRLTELLGGLGYPSYTSFAGLLREADPITLRALADRVLALTDDLYVKVTTELAQRELSLPRASLTRADFARLFRPRGVDAYFPKDALADRVRKTAAGLGTDLETLDNLRIDSREDARKNPHPLALAVAVPEDVRLSYRPLGGVEDYAAVLHELAHALHYAHAQALPFELAKLGNPTVTEAYGALFEDLLQDPAWLQQSTSLPPERLPAYLAASSAYLLHRLRVAAGAVLYGLLARESDEAEARSVYARVMARTLMIKLTPEDEARLWVDREDFLESADRLRSLCLAGQLQAQLTARFGPAWWAHSGAGAFLRGLWAHANARSADELAVLLGETGLQPDVLIARLSATLSAPVRAPRPAASAGSPDGGN